MKKNTLVISLILSAFLIMGVQPVVMAYAPPVSEPVCGHCGRKEGHEPWCPSHIDDEETESVQFPKVPIFPDAPCPECGGTDGNHKSDCNLSHRISKNLSYLEKYKEQYYSARTAKERDFALLNIKRIISNLQMIKNEWGEAEKSQQQEQPKQYAREKKVHLRDYQVEQKSDTPVTAPEQVSRPLYNSQFNIPKAEEIIGGNFEVDGKTYDKKISFHIEGAAVAYGYTNPYGIENWDLYGSNGSLRYEGIQGVTTFEYGNQHYFCLKQKSILGNIQYILTDVYAKDILSVSDEPFISTVRLIPTDNGTESRMLFVKKRGPQEELRDVIEQISLMSVKNGHIETKSLGMGNNSLDFKVQEENGYYGIKRASYDSVFPEQIVPCKYHTISERYRYGEKNPYYIVSNGGSSTFGAYSYDGKLLAPPKYTLTQIIKKINDKDFD